MNRKKIILNRKIIAAIVASVMVATLFFSSMGAVTANHTASVDVKPKEMKGNSRQLLRINVSNSEDSQDNINKVWFDPGACIPENACIIAGSTNGGYFIAAADNLSVASENLEDAEYLLQVAGSNKQKFALLLENMSEDVGIASEALNTANKPRHRDAGEALDSAKSALHIAYEELSVEPENMVAAEDMLKRATQMFENAAENFTTLTEVKENLLEASSYLDNAADNISAGDFKTASTNFISSALALKNAGTAMKGSTDLAVQYAGDDLIRAASHENSAGYVFGAAAENINAAGMMFDSASMHLDIAGNILSTIDCIENAGENLRSASNLLDNVAMEMKYSVSPQDIFAAGDNLTDSASYFDTAGSILLDALGGDHLRAIGSVPGYIANAGENLNRGTFDLGTAAGQITETATQLGLAADAMETTGYTLYSETPEDWRFGSVNVEGSTFPGFTATNITGENTLAPGENTTFPILIETPDMTACCDFTVYTADITGACALDETDDYTFDLCFDTTCPDLSTRVYQSKVPENNLVGDEYDNGMATVEIAADEPISSIGAVKVQVKNMDTGEYENVKTVDVSPGENKMVYTGEFAVEEWDDNDTQIWIESWSDEFGNKCKDYSWSFCVDTRAPVWNENCDGANVDNGIPGALDMHARRFTGRDQAPENLWATCIDTWTINGMVTDNCAGPYCFTPGSEYPVVPTPQRYLRVQALVNGQVVEQASVKNWTGHFSAGDVELGAEGLKDITIRAIDLTGNVIENTVENVLLDQTPPTISGFTPEDGAVLNDNGVDVSVTVSDAGLGVENATLYDNTTGTLEKLDYKDNYLSSVTLEETVETWPEGVNEFVVKATDGLTYTCFYCAEEVFENENHVIDREPENCEYICPEDVNGCPEPELHCDKRPVYDTYTKCTRENEIQCYHDVSASWSFRVDVTSPNPPSIDSTCVGTACTPIATQSSWHIIAGSIDEATWEHQWETYEDISVNVYAKPDGGSRSIVGEGITPDQAGYWSTEVNLSEGRNEIFVEQVDEAGNKSQLTSKGFVTVDTENPSVSITAPEDGTTTSKKLITLKASVDDAQTSLGELDITISTPTRTISNPPVNEDGEIVKSIPLTEGKNTISVMVEDMAKNKNSASIAVTKTKPTNWALYAAIAAVIAIILAAIAILRRGS